MVKEKALKEPVVERALSVPDQKTVVLQGDPKQQLEFAKQCSVALMDVLKLKPKKVMINGRQYLEYEDWQTLARFYGASVGTEWTKPLERGGKLIGYEAKAIVTMKGELVSSAESMCTRDERNWALRDEFALRSMAQTRACAKALRNVFAWIVVMAGLAATPAEEMDGVPHDPQPTRKPLVSIDEAKKKLAAAKNIDELKKVWSTLPAEIKLNDDVELLKEDLKLKFEPNQ